METTDIQLQIDSINSKLDIVLEHINQQRLKQERIDDLMDDLSVIGKDIFTHSVKELDRAGVEIQGEDMVGLGLKFLRNIHTINEMFDMLVSASDLMKDMEPVVRQIGLDAINKMHELENRGYFEFARELGKVADNVVANFGKEDVSLLADNIVSILQTIKNLTQPDMLKALNNAVLIFKSLEMENIPEYSVWKAMRELRTPEIKRSMGLMITLLKNLSQQSESLKQI